MRIGGAEGDDLEVGWKWCRRRYLSEEKAEKTRSSLPLPVQFLAAWVECGAHALGSNEVGLPQGGESGPQGQARRSQACRHGR